MSNTDRQQPVERKLPRWRKKTDDVVLSQTPMMKCKFESKFNLDYASHSGAYLVSIICI